MQKGGDRVGEQWFPSRGWIGMLFRSSGKGPGSEHGPHLACTHMSRWLCPELSQETLMGGLMAGKVGQAGW